MTNRSDLFNAFRFELRIDDKAVGGFSECSGLQADMDVHNYHEGGENDHILKFGGVRKLSNIILKRGVIISDLGNWFESTQGQTQYKNESITIYDPAGQKVLVEWRFKRAFPIKWSGPDLNATQSNIAMETLELAHHGLEMRPG